MDNTIMNRLRAANPAVASVVTDEELHARIIAMPPDARLVESNPTLQRRSSASVRGLRGRLPRWRAPRRLGLRRWGALHWSIVWVTTAAVAGAVVLAVFAGSSPTAAQAFPVLDEHPALTPASLGQALRIYGVAPGDAGLNIRQGHPITTPWGTGYVLTNRDRSVICVLAPGTAAQPWGASCARTDIARRYGTASFEYAYDKSADSARFITLLPAGATATAQPADGQPQALAIHDGVLAFDVTSPTILTTRIDGRATVVYLSPRDANSATAGPAGSETTTTTSATDARAGQ